MDLLLIHALPGWECLDSTNLDKYSEYPKGFVTDPEGLAYESEEVLSRVLRGGSWGSNAQHLRSASRSHYRPDSRNHFIGLRLAGG